MRRLAETCEKIAGTTKKLEKTALVATYLQSCQPDEGAAAAVFLSGRPFPLWDEVTLQVGGSLLWRIVAELSGKSEDELTLAYRRHGDLGSVAGEVLPQKSNIADISIQEVQQRFGRIAAARGTAAKALELRALLLRSTPLEAKYIIKIITGDLRIGLKESLVEDAIAKAYGASLSEVQRANMLLGDIGETVKFAASGKLVEARMRLFHPLGFMLASPAQSSDEALSYFQDALVEDKYDGIRAQAHCSGDKVKIFSRTRDDITVSFPELPPALAGFSEDVIFDGEIVAWSYLGSDSQEDGRALPFTALQQRLGRKKVSEQMLRDIPVAYIIFDVLYKQDELLLDRPLVERGEILNTLLASPRKAGLPIPSHPQSRLGFETAEDPAVTKILRAPVWRASSPGEVDKLFDSAQARGNEGLMIKAPLSPYTPGRRGKSWLKLKRELATLDVVITAAEYGHGKRIKVLSDYTFAVRDGDRLVNIGKAYSGLTDVEIAEMTTWFLEHTVEDQGMRLLVEPRRVIEVAFNNMMLSDRHNSGYALRFPRIVRLRPDKLPEEIDTLERVKQIYEKQK
ncbi:MAG: ATP-dependent DNA ligase [Acidobacteriota bacterium]|nr:ATP-dependent DNA ligase [Acidobacteriota bacterium]